MKRWVVLAAAVVSLSCKRGSEEEARQAVRRYVDLLAKAYRTSDSSIVDPLVGDEQGLKLVGLIGVKRDAGVVLDAKLLDLQFTRVAREGSQWVVETKERWYYVDRKIGTGQQVGEDSADSYALRYTFTNKDGRLILDKLAFIGEPVVGRKSAPLPQDPKAFHGIAPGAENAPLPPGHPPTHGAPAPAAGQQGGAQERRP
jgi:hypothetical protein